VFRFSTASDTFAALVSAITALSQASFDLISFDLSCLKMRQSCTNAVNAFWRRLCSKELTNKGRSMMKSQTLISQTILVIMMISPSVHAGMAQDHDATPKPEQVYTEVTETVDTYAGDNWNNKTDQKIKPGERLEVLQWHRGGLWNSYSLVKIPSTGKTFWILKDKLSQDTGVLTRGRISKNDPVADPSKLRAEQIVPIIPPLETPIKAKPRPKPVIAPVVVNETPKVEEPRAQPTQVVSALPGTVVVNTPARPEDVQNLLEDQRRAKASEETLAKYKPGIAIPDWATKKSDQSRIPAKVQTVAAPVAADAPLKCPEGQVPHAGSDSAKAHCHPDVKVVAKVDPTKKADPEKKSADKCQNWASPMRGKHNLTDCIGAVRSASGNVVTRRHAGVDLGNGQQANTKIFSVAPGKIIQAGWMGGYGCVIQVQHDSCPSSIRAYSSLKTKKCISFYAHLQTERGGKCPAANKIGEKVNSCSSMAIMGGTGGNYPKHLHFEMRIKENASLRLNPMVALGPELKAAASNPGRCSATETWLAATPGGSATAYTNGRTAQDTYRGRSVKGRAN
jgi:murein DD-endopeptidase MepM/ murein hydrolase activator NlpD